MTDAPERIWAVPERNCTVYMSGNSPITAQDGPFTHRLHGAALEYIRADLVEAMETENRRLREALVQAAVPLEGLTLAANYSESNMGLCKGTWEEINNGVAHIRAALSSTGEK